jgi:hypothetical protein
MAVIYKIIRRHRLSELAGTPQLMATTVLGAGMETSSWVGGQKPKGNLQSCNEMGDIVMTTLETRHCCYFEWRIPGARPGKAFEEPTLRNHEHSVMFIVENIQRSWQLSLHGTTISCNALPMTMRNKTYQHHLTTFVRQKH